jgi:predicted PurR-regulated permease PerM
MQSQQNHSSNLVVNYAIQLLALALVLVWCFRIIEPFITLLVWGGVLAITLYPIHQKLAARLKNRAGLSAVIVTVSLALIILGPAVWLLIATVEEFRLLGELYRAGTLHVPPPPETVKSWPVIGSTLFTYWSQAATNLTALVHDNAETVKGLLLQLFDLLKNTTAGLLMFLLSIIVSGVFLAYAQPIGSFLHQMLVRIAGSTGETMTSAAEATVRNVAKGVLGVAVIQSILAGIGMVLAGIPFAGLWILICLILAIIQVGLLPVTIGVIVYTWGHDSTLTASLLTGWMLFVGIIDNVLKPILLGKGAPAPMMVVFLGAIGGFLMSGFIGLFTGAIVLTLGYKLVISWLNAQPATNPEAKDQG